MKGDLAQTQQELMIVNAVAKTGLPEGVMNGSKIKELVDSINNERRLVGKHTDAVKDARKAKDRGNFLTNMLKGRGGHLEDARMDLEQSVSRLTGATSELMIINTAMSVVLSGQQKLLNEQQVALAEQAEEILEQNRKIQEQQLIQEEQQRAINAANAGLMKAKGISNEQAAKLVDCVVRIEEAEKSMRASNADLLHEVDAALKDMGRDVGKVGASVENLYEMTSTLIREQKGTLSLTNTLQDELHEEKQARQELAEGMVSSAESLTAALRTAEGNLSSTFASSIKVLRGEAQDGLDAHRAASGAQLTRLRNGQLACAAVLLALLAWQGVLAFGLMV